MPESKEDRGDNDEGNGGSVREPSDPVVEPEHTLPLSRSPAIPRCSLFGACPRLVYAGGGPQDGFECTAQETPPFSECMTVPLWRAA